MHSLARLRATRDAHVAGSAPHQRPVSTWQPCRIRQHVRIDREAPGPAPLQCLSRDPDELLLPAFTVEASRLPNQAETMFSGTGNAEDIIVGLAVADAPTKSTSDLDYLSVSCSDAAGRPTMRSLPRPDDAFPHIDAIAKLAPRLGALEGKEASE